MSAIKYPAGLTLRIENLALARGGRRLASGLDFVLPGGRALVVTGPNGSGKSTLLRTLAGFLAAEAGTVSLAGAGDDANVASHAHYIGHADAQKHALSVAENLAFWADMLGSQLGMAPREALQLLGLAHALDLPVGYLSAGQKRRAALARLLVAPRPLWLLDEPATALDLGSQKRLASIMGEHLAAGGMIVAATHAPLGLEGAGSLVLGETP